MKTRCWLLRKPGLTLTARRALLPAGSARALFISLDHTTVRAVHTRKESVQCVEKKFWTQRTTNRHLCDSLSIREQLQGWDWWCMFVLGHIFRTVSCHRHLWLFTVILPTFVKERDLEVALPSYYIKPLELLKWPYHQLSPAPQVEASRFFCIF